MAEHPNAALVRRGIEAANEGDVATMAALTADDVVWHVIGSAEPLRGKAALMAHQAVASDAVGCHVRIRDILANDDRVVALLESTATRGDRALTYRTAEIFDVRDGQVVERSALADDTAAITAFFA